MGPARGASVTSWWVAAALLPAAGLLVLLLRSQLDPDWMNQRVHFSVFLAVGIVDFVLCYAAGEAARKRGDARVLLISLTFLATGCFLALHAIGTPGILFTRDFAGFKVAIPVGLLVAACFAVASAFVDLRPEWAAVVVRRRRALRGAIYAAIAAWFCLTVAAVPPLDRPTSEGGADSLLALLAAGGSVAYALAAARYWHVYRDRPGLLPISVIACFVLLAEAMVGVALTGERAWHASWWEWHALIVVAFVIVGLAARRQWLDERFRELYLPATRERRQEVSVLFSDLAGFTGFTERAAPEDVARMLSAYFGLAAPIVARCGGTVERFSGDGMMATFNARGDQPDHVVRAARAALGLQRDMAELLDANPGWPRLRVGVNTGTALVRELGGEGHVAYTLVGDSVNVGARLEANAPPGGVLIGDETYRRLPRGTDAHPMPGLRVKGREGAVDAFVLRSMP